MVPSPFHVNDQPWNSSLQSTLCCAIETDQGSWNGTFWKRSTYSTSSEFLWCTEEWVYQCIHQNISRNYTRWRQFPIKRLSWTLLTVCHPNQKELVNDSSSNGPTLVFFSASASASVLSILFQLVSGFLNSFPYFLFWFSFFVFWKDVVFFGSFVQFQSDFLFLLYLRMFGFIFCGGGGVILIPNKMFWVSILLVDWQSLKFWFNLSLERFWKSVHVTPGSWKQRSIVSWCPICQTTLHIPWN